MHVSRSNHLDGFGPRHSDKSTLTTRLVVAATALRIIHDIGPGQHWITQPLLGLPVHLQENPAGVRILTRVGE